MSKCFDASKPRYMTKGIEQKMPMEYQFLIWNYIDELDKSIDLDYLQVFDFSIENHLEMKIQCIEHSQEVPEYQTTHKISNPSETITGRVFVIDDGDHSTMLWASEY